MDGLLQAVSLTIAGVGILSFIVGFLNGYAKGRNSAPEREKRAHIDFDAVTMRTVTVDGELWLWADMGELLDELPYWHAENLIRVLESRGSSTETLVYIDE